MDFVDRIHGGETKGYAILAFRTFGDGDEVWHHVGLPLDRDWRSMAARELAKHADWDCYVGIANYAVPPAPGKGTPKRQLWMIGHGRWLIVERDAHPRSPALLQATLTVETSEGNYQDWYLLDAPTDAATIGDYQRRMAHVVGIGTEAVDATRVLRLPGMVNRKRGRGGFVVRVVSDTGAVYPLAAFDDLPEAPKPRALHIVPTPTPGQVDAATLARQACDRVQQGEGRNKAGYWLACRLFDNGYSMEDAERFGCADYVRHVPAWTADGVIAPYTDEEYCKSVASAYARRVRETAAAPDRADPPAGHEAHPRPADPRSIDFHNTETGNAERLVAHHGSDLRYCHTMGTWLAWDARRWKIDEERVVERQMKAVVREMFTVAMDDTLPKEPRIALVKWAFRSEARAVIRNSIDRAIAEPDMSIGVDALDHHPHLLTVRNGTIDLRTGRLAPHDRAHFITHLVDVSYDPDATCPHWTAFIERALPDADVRALVQRAVGYSLTGETSERALLIPWGDSGGGKTTLLETLHMLLGDYAARVDSKTFLTQRHYDNREYVVAEMRGARMVYSVEPEEDARLAEAFVKEATGGDRLAGRHPYGRPFSFEPTHTLWLATNHRPEIRGTDNAIWNRIRLIPFTEIIPKAEQKPKHEVLALFRAELPGILAWAIRGAVDWYANGLGEAVAVTAATAAYRTDMDIVGAWIADCCVEGPSCSALVSDLRASYEAWCATNGTTPISGTAFGRRLSARNYTQGRSPTGKRTWIGVGLLASGAPEPPPPDGTAAPPAGTRPFDTFDGFDTFPENSSRVESRLEKLRETRQNASNVSNHDDGGNADKGKRVLTRLPGDADAEHEPAAGVISPAPADPAIVIVRLGAWCETVAGTNWGAAPTPAWVVTDAAAVGVVVTPEMSEQESARAILAVLDGEEETQ
jgi:putative DNA primase/helicase